MLVYNLKILIFIFVFHALGLNETWSQVKVQVVSQKINKSFDWKPGISLQLKAERAEIFCTSHAGSTIEVEVTFIAKHENKKIAESDLKKMKWLYEELSKKIFIRNYIELARNESKPESDIKAVYHIKVPENCSVDISNYFGNIEVKNMNFKLNINSEFSKIDLQNISGKTTIKTTFGDVSAQRIKGNMRIESNRSDIDILKLEGDLDIQAQIANLTLTEFNNFNSINIDAEKSIINLKAENYDGFNLELELTKTELTKPEKMILNYIENEKDKIKANFNKSNHPQIDIKINLGSLTIEEM